MAKVYLQYPWKFPDSAYYKHLVYPGYSDSFGFAFLEAMAFGLPIVTVDGFARREIVEDGKNGFVIERPEIAWKINSPPEIQRFPVVYQRFFAALLPSNELYIELQPIK